MGKREHATKFPKDTALHTLTFPEIGHRFDSLQKPQRSHAAREEQGQKSSRDTLKCGFQRFCSRLCVSGTLGGFKAQLSRAQAAVGCQGSCGEWCCSFPGKHRRGGSCLQRCREPVTDLRLRAARPQHLPEWLRGCCAHSRPCHHLQRCGRGQHSSAAQGRWGWRCRSCSPPAAFPGGHPKSSGQPRAGGEAPTSISFYCTILSRPQNTLPAWGAVLSPSMTSLDSILLSSAF